MNGSSGGNRFDWIWKFIWWEKLQKLFEREKKSNFQRFLDKISKSLKETPLGLINVIFSEVFVAIFAN